MDREGVCTTRHSPRACCQLSRLVASEARLFIKSTSYRNLKRIGGDERLRARLLDALVRRVKARVTGVGQETSHLDANEIFLVENRLVITRAVLAANTFTILELA